MLSASEVESFVADGYVAIRGAVPADAVRACREMIWSALGQHGVTARRPGHLDGRWSDLVPRGRPVRRRRDQAGPWEAFDQLIGPGRWWRRPGVGGTIPVRFPSQADPGDAGWHIEASYEATGTSGSTSIPGPAGCWCCTCSATSTTTARRPESAPGSHRDAARVLAPGRGRRAALDRGGANGRADASAHRPTALATGEAGDVFLCHPVPVHAASWPHAGGLRPRIDGAARVALHDQCPLTRPAQPGRAGDTRRTRVRRAGHGRCGWRPCPALAALRPGGQGLPDGALRLARPDDFEQVEGVVRRGATGRGRCPSGTRCCSPWRTAGRRRPGSARADAAAESAADVGLVEMRLVCSSDPPALTFASPRRPRPLAWISALAALMGAWGGLLSSNSTAANLSTPFT